MITTTCYRYWREGHDAGLRIEPAAARDPRTGEWLDFAWSITGPRPQDTMQIVTDDLESWLATWLSDFYRDEPGARAQAAERGIRMALDWTAT